MPGSHKELQWGHVGTVDRFDCAGLTVTGFDSFDRFDCASGVVMSDTYSCFNVKVRQQNAKWAYTTRQNI